MLKNESESWLLLKNKYYLVYIKKGSQRKTWWQERKTSKFKKNAKEKKQNRKPMKSALTLFSKRGLKAYYIRLIWRDTSYSQALLSSSWIWVSFSQVWAAQATLMHNQFWELTLSESSQKIFPSFHWARSASCKKLSVVYFIHWQDFCGSFYLLTSYLNMTFNQCVLHYRTMKLN